MIVDAPLIPLSKRKAFLLRLLGNGELASIAKMMYLDYFYFSIFFKIIKIIIFFGIDLPGDIFYQDPVSFSFIIIQAI